MITDRKWFRKFEKIPAVKIEDHAGVFLADDAAPARFASAAAVHRERRKGSC